MNSPTEQQALVNEKGSPSVGISVYDVGAGISAAGEERGGGDGHDNNHDGVEGETSAINSIFHLAAPQQGSDTASSNYRSLTNLGGTLAGTTNNTNYPSTSDIFVMSQRPVSATVIASSHHTPRDRGGDEDGGEFPLSAREIFAAASSAAAAQKSISSSSNVYTQEVREDNNNNDRPSSYPPAAEYITTSPQIQATAVPPPPRPSIKFLDSKSSQELSRNVAILMRQYSLGNAPDSPTSSERSSTPKPPSVTSLINLLKQYENTIDDYLLIESATDLGLGPLGYESQSTLQSNLLTTTQQQQQHPHHHTAGMSSSSSPTDSASAATTGRTTSGGVGHGVGGGVFVPLLPVPTHGGSGHLGVPIGGTSLTSSVNSSSHRPSYNGDNGSYHNNGPVPSTKSPLIPTVGGGGGRFRAGAGFSSQYTTEDWDVASSVGSLASERRISVGGLAAANALKHFQSKINPSSTNQQPKRRSMQQVSLKPSSSPPPLSATVIAKQQLLDSPSNLALSNASNTLVSATSPNNDDNGGGDSSSFHSSLSYYSSPTPSMYAEESPATTTVMGSSTSPRGRKGSSAAHQQPPAAALHSASFMSHDNNSNTPVRSSPRQLGESSRNFSGGFEWAGTHPNPTPVGDISNLLSGSMDFLPALIGGAAVPMDDDSSPLQSNTTPRTSTIFAKRGYSVTTRRKSGFDAGVDMLMMSQARHEDEEKRRAREEWKLQHRERADNRRKAALAATTTTDASVLSFSDVDSSITNNNNAKEKAARRARYEERKKAKRQRRKEAKKIKEAETTTLKEGKAKKRPASSKKKGKELGGQDNDNFTQEQLALLGRVADVEEESATVGSGHSTPRVEEPSVFSFRQVPAWIEGIHRTRLRQRDEEWEKVEKLADEGIFSSKYLEVDDHAETIIPPEIMANNFSTAEQRTANVFLEYFNRYAIYTVFIVAVLQIVYLGIIIYRCSFDNPYDVAGYIGETVLMEIPTVAFTFVRGLYFPIDKKGVYIVDNALQRKTYTRSRWFVLDVIGALPLEIIGFAIGSQCTKSNFVVCRFLSPYWKLNRLIILRSFAEDTSAVLEEISFRRGMHPSIARVTTTFFQMLGISHLVACIFNVMLVFDNSLVLDWLVDPIHDDRGSASKYLQALDWATKSIVGFAKGNPFNIPMIPVIFTLIVAFFGIAVFASFIGAITAYLQRPSAWNNTLTAIDSILDEFNRQEMPKDIVNDATTFYWHLYETARHSDSVIQALDGLPKPLQVRLLAQIGSDLLRKVPLLRPEVADQKFVLCLTVALVPQVMVPYTTLFRKGDKGDSMAFITHGKLGVVPATFEEDHDLGSVFFVLKGGSYVGEIALILGVPRTATVSSLDRYANLLVMHKDDFSQIAKDFPSAARRLRIEAESRLSSSLQKGSDALNFERARRLFDAVSDDKRKYCYGVWLAFTVAKGEQREAEALEGEMGDAVYHAVKVLGEEALCWEDETHPIESGSAGSNPSEGGLAFRKGTFRSESRASLNLPQHPHRSSGDPSLDADTGIVRIDVNNGSFNQIPSAIFGTTAPPNRHPGEQQRNNNNSGTPTNITATPVFSAALRGSVASSGIDDSRRQSYEAFPPPPGGGTTPSAERLRRVVAYIEHVRQKKANALAKKSKGVVEESDGGDPFYDVVMKAIQAAKQQKNNSS